MEEKIRLTAYKIWIKMLLSGQYVEQEGEWEPNYMLCNNQKISRVNVLGTVISSDFQENVGSLTIDDGSAIIAIRAFKEDVGMLRETGIGDIITVIGRVRSYQNNIYITPEIVKKVDNPGWLAVRKLELKKLYGEQEKEEESKLAKETIVIQTTPELHQRSKEEPKQQTVQKKETTERQRILHLVRNAGEEGIMAEKLLIEAQLREEEAEEVITSLLKEGEIYMPRPGRLKIV